MQPACSIGFTVHILALWCHTLHLAPQSKSKPLDYSPFEETQLGSKSPLLLDSALALPCFPFGGLTSDFERRDINNVCIYFKRTYTQLAIKYR